MANPSEDGNQVRGSEALAETILRELNTYRVMQAVNLNQHQDLRLDRYVASIHWRRQHTLCLSRISILRQRASPDATCRWIAEVKEPFSHASQ